MEITNFEWNMVAAIASAVAAICSLIVTILSQCWTIAESKKRRKMEDEQNIKQLHKRLVSLLRRDASSLEHYMHNRGRELCRMDPIPVPSALSREADEAYSDFTAEWTFNSKFFPLNGHGQYVRDRREIINAVIQSTTKEDAYGLTIAANVYNKTLQDLYDLIGKSLSNQAGNGAPLLSPTQLAPKPGE